MLAVVVLLPIVMMVVACLLERFEAHATRPAAPRRSRRSATAAPTSPSLALVPDANGEPDADEITPAALRAAS